MYTGGTGRRSDAWRLEQGWTRELPKTVRRVLSCPSLTRSGGHRAVGDFTTQQPDERFMSYSELRDYTAAAATSGFDVSGQLVALERKISFPFVTNRDDAHRGAFAVTTGRHGAM